MSYYSTEIHYLKCNTCDRKEVIHDGLAHWSNVARSMGWSLKPNEEMWEKAKNDLEKMSRLDFSGLIIAKCPGCRAQEETD